MLLPLYVIYVFQFLQMMTLNALNHPRDTFWITSVMVLVNIALIPFMIPIIGITGAAIATFISILISAILGYLSIRKYISVKMEKKPLLRILGAVAVMALVVGGLRLVVPVIDLGYLIGLVIIGAVVYFGLLFKIDKDISDELKAMITQ